MEKEETNNTQKLKEKILTQIKNGKVKIKSKFSFILKNVLLIVGIIALILLALLILSFVFFNLKVKGLFFLSHIGPHGLKMFLINLPWLLILIVLVILIILELFAKNLAVVYRRPLLISFFVLFGLILIGSLILNRTPLHPYFFSQSKKQMPPPVYGYFYRRIGPPKPPSRFQSFVWRGNIKELTNKGFNLETYFGEILEIQTSTLRQNLSEPLKIGESVAVIGKKKGTIIEAEKILKTEDIFRKPPRK